MLWLLASVVGTVEDRTGKRRLNNNIMNQIQVFGQSGRGIFMQIEKSGVRDPALSMLLQEVSHSGDIMARKAPDFWWYCKSLFFRRLPPIFAFFTPFLSHKRLISRRLQEIQVLFISREGREVGRLLQKPAKRAGLAWVVPHCPAWSRIVPGAILFGTSVSREECEGRKRRANPRAKTR